jgi:hypothetical protein
VSEGGGEEGGEGKEEEEEEEKHRHIRNVRQSGCDRKKQRKREIESKT